MTENKRTPLARRSATEAAQEFFASYSAEVASARSLVVHLHEARELYSIEEVSWVGRYLMGAGPQRVRVNLKLARSLEELLSSLEGEHGERRQRLLDINDSLAVTRRHVMGAMTVSEAEAHEASRKVRQEQEDGFLARLGAPKLELFKEKGSTEEEYLATVKEVYRLCNAVSPEQVRGDRGSAQLAEMQAAKSSATELLLGLIDSINEAMASKRSSAMMSEIEERTRNFRLWSQALLRAHEELARLMTLVKTALPKRRGEWATMHDRGAVQLVAGFQEHLRPIATAMREASRDLAAAYDVDARERMTELLQRGEKENA